MKSVEEKIEAMRKKFCSLASQEKRYHFLIEMGRNLPPYPPERKTPEYLVRGCQSALYLFTEEREGKIFFSATADALISAGLAALLIGVYNGEKPEILLKHTPHFLTELGIFASLSPNRSNGLAALHQRMVQEALKIFTSKNLSL